jgi:hypothetical protein
MNPRQDHHANPHTPGEEKMLTPALRRSNEVASYLKLQHFPLTSAYLCQDCNAIGNNANQCPACASEVLMSLAVVLNRAVEMPAHQFATFPSLAASSPLNGSALAA